MIMSLNNVIISNLNTIIFFVKEKIYYLSVKRKLNSLLKNKNPKISIILPTYNRCEMLKKRSIPTVLKQNYKNFELVIVSDGSTDRTHKVVKSFKDKRIKFFEIKRQKKYNETIENHWFAGPVNAINKGLENASGDWIARIDDDDIWTSDHLKSLLFFARKNNYEFVSSAHIEYRYKKKIHQNHKNFRPRIGGVQSWLYAGYLNFFKANKDCWRKSWNRVNDLDLQDRMYKVGIKMGYLDKVTVILKPRPGDKTIGIDAYKNKKKYYLKKYEFKK